MYVFALFLLLFLLLFCSVFFSLFPAPCTSESLLEINHSPSANTRGTSRMFGKLPKSPNLVCPKLHSGSDKDEGPDEDRRTKGRTMWLSAILFSFFLTLTFCEEKKDTDKGPIVRARLEVC